MDPNLNSSGSKKFDSFDTENDKNVILDHNGNNFDKKAELDNRNSENELKIPEDKLKMFKK